MRRPDGEGAPAGAADIFPRPRRISRLAGALEIARDAPVELCISDQTHKTIVDIVVTELRRAGVAVVTRGKSRNAPGSALIVALQSSGVDGGPQGYRLSIRPRGEIAIEARTHEGFRHAAITLRQLIKAGGGRMQAMRLEDWPDFESRGVMLDISRDKVPTIETLHRLIDRFADWKLNELQLYTEHTFAYRGHEVVWRGASPLTEQEIVRLDAYCRERGIELVPNQNSLGHMERWLKHGRYAGLAECSGPWQTPWGEMRSRPTTLCPIDPRSIALVEDLYAQLLPHFSSNVLNVGCDEPFELGQGRSAAACRRRGEGRVYLDYLLKVRRAAAQHGRRIQFWSDWIQRHPEMISRLPRDVTPMVWGYEADHPFDVECARVRKAGLRFYVCPGTSSWCSFGGRTENALANLRNAARSGMRHGAAGYLVTDWGDYGHRQYLPVSYGTLLYGAGVSWCRKTNESIDIGAQMARQWPECDEAMASGWLAAGRVCEEVGMALKNQTVLFRAMQRPLDDGAGLAGLRVAEVETMEGRIEDARGMARGAVVRDEQARLCRDELTQTLRVLRHACRRVRYAMALAGGRRPTVSRVWLARDMRGIIDEHRRLWRMRNRPGGLASSVGYYGKTLREYGLM